MPGLTKRRLIHKLGISMELPARIYIEQEIVPQLQTAFGHYPSVQQFSVGSYRIDLYFPAQKVAVECDEHSHAGYDQTAEAARQQFVQDQLGCSFVRFDPHDKCFCLMKLINQIMLVMLAK